MAKPYSIAKLSIISYIVGFLIVVTSLIRWVLIYNDTSQFVLAGSIGIIICAGAYIYNWMRSTDHELKKIHERINAFTSWVGKIEFKK